MSSDQEITKGQIALAVATAVVVDIIQLPVNLAFFASAATGLGLLLGGVPLETVDAALDVITAFLMSALLGFHWVLLPSFVLEIVPGLDAAPTWTGCVLYLAHLRHKQGRIAANRTPRLQRYPQ